MASGVSDGSALTFEGLDYGYYAVQTTQGATITVTSTNPNVTVVDKNSKEPTAEKKVNGKDEDSASIGEVVTYTAKFDTANYIGEGENAWKVESYTIADTLPEFLTDVHITGLKIVQDAKDATKTEDLSSSYTEFTNKKIIIPWVDNNGDSLYKNGSVIELTYTAKVTGTVNVNTANTNIVSITPNKDKEGNQPHNESWDDNAVIKTYGTALKKIDGETKAALKGAEFTVAGLVVEEVTGEPGVYKVVSYDPNSTTASAAMTTNDEGMLYIIGLKDSVTLSATETKAPEGYNLAEDTISLPAQQLTEAIYETSGERYYDEKGNLVSESSTATTTVTVDKNYTDLDPQAVTVENNKGSLLPSTGGMGTTIFYLLGGILVIGAAIMLIARRRVESEK